MLDGIGELLRDRLWEIVTACTGAMLGVKNLPPGGRLATLVFFVVSLIFAFAAVPPILAWAGVAEVAVYRPIALFVLALVALRIIEALPVLAAKVKNLNLPYSGGNSQ